MSHVRMTSPGFFSQVWRMRVYRHDLWRSTLATPFLLERWEVAGEVALGGTVVVPSGKHTKNYGKSPCLMGKSTINGHFQ